MTDIPLVSISCITFNHAPYLRECFDGFLMQQADFQFEVVVHDDASTDGTREVIEEYTAKYPDIFVPMYQTENQYSQGVRGMMARFNFPRCKGKYIALCEGDDYWTDALKLQKQVDFLESNQDYVLVGGKTSTVSDIENFEIIREPVFRKEYDFNTGDLLLSNPLSTLTACFRNNIIKVFPDIFYEGYAGDLALYLLLSKHGKCKFFSDNYGVYRKHSGGVSNAFKGGGHKKIMNLIESINRAERWNRFFKNKYDSQILKIRHKNSPKIIKYYFKNNEWKLAIPYLQDLKFSKLNLKMKMMFILLSVYSKFV